MPGLAPAQKAKKGRFGAGGTAPDLVIESFAAEVTTAVANTTDFVASASDAVDGDITATIDWTSDLDAASVGTGGTPSITLTALGTHTITVTATAPTGGQTTVKTIQVECVA